MATLNERWRGFQRQLTGRRKNRYRLGFETLEARCLLAAPVAAADTFLLLEDQTLNVASLGVLANDSADDPNLLSAVLADGPAQGNLTSFQSNGYFTFVPPANFNGNITFTYRAFDGTDYSDPATVTLEIGAVNDAPSFTAGGNQTVNEDAGPQTVNSWATSIAAGPADEAGQSLTFQVANDNNGLFAVQPIIDAAGHLTYTPAANANGVATVTVALGDNGGTSNGGVDTSAPQTFTITITAVNDAPSFTKGADQTVNEDAGAQTVGGWATNLSAGPADEAGQTLSFQVSNDNNSLFAVQPSIDASGQLTYTLAADANGAATVTVAIIDNGGTSNGGVDTSAPQTFTITVTAVNDAPSFTKGADQTVNEDAGTQTVGGWATNLSAGPADEAGQALSFQVSNDFNSLFAVQPNIDANGQLTYTLAADANGAATVTVAIIDNGGTINGGVDTSATQTFTITVTAVNDAPSFTKGADQTVNEDAGAQTVGGWATNLSAGPADEAGQTLSFQVTNDANSLFAVQPSIDASGQLTYTLAADANGVATVTVAIIDSGGTSNGGVDTSATQTFTITVTAVNDAPSFTKGADQTVNEDAGAQTVGGWATSLSAGPADEAGQALSFQVTNDANSLFAVQPSIDANGQLTFTLTADANGVATVTVAIIDNGGTSNDGVDTSATQTFSITVIAVNDAPSFTKGADQTVNEDSGAQTISGWATNLSAGPADEADQVLTFQVTTYNNALFAVQPSIAANGDLTYTVATDAWGTATVTVALRDDGVSANGGSDTSAAVTFAITVNPANDSPTATVFVSGATITEGETAFLYGAITDIDGPDAFVVTVAWGDGHTDTISVPTGSTAYGASHLYADDDPTATESDLHIITVTVQDSSNATGSTTAELTVHNAPPSNLGLGVDIVTVAEAVTIALSGSFTDPGILDTFTVTIDWDDGTGPTTVVLGPGVTRFSNVFHQYVAADPNQNEHGSYTISVIIADDDDGTLVGTTDVTFNQAPVACAETYAPNQNLTLNMPADGVLWNDFDPDGDALTAILVTGPAWGSLILNPDGSFTYIPDPDWSGTDSFIYVAFDGTLQSSLCTVTLIVNPGEILGNQPVFAHNLTFTVQSGTGLQGTVSRAGVDHNWWFYEQTSCTEHGTLIFNADGTFTYQPDDNYLGTDTFDYRVFNNSGFSDEATVTIVVDPYEMVVFLNYDLSGLLAEQTAAPTPANPFNLTSADWAAFDAARAQWVSQIGRPSVSANLKSFAQLQGYVEAAEAKLAEVRARAQTLTDMRAQPQNFTKEQYLEALYAGVYYYDWYLRIANETIMVQGQFVADNWFFWPSDEALMNRVYALPRYVASIDVALTPEQRIDSMNAGRQVGQALNNLTDNLRRAEGAMQGLGTVGAVLTVGIVGIVFVPVAAAYVGATLLTGATLFSAGTRALQGQSALQVVGGTIGDLTGFNDICISLYGVDPVTGQQLDLSPEEQGRRFATGGLQLFLSVTGLASSLGRVGAFGSPGGTNSISIPLPRVQTGPSYAMAGGPAVPSPAVWSWVPVAEASPTVLMASTKVVGTVRLTTYLMNMSNGQPAEGESQGSTNPPTTEWPTEVPTTPQTAGQLLARNCVADSQAIQQKIGGQFIRIESPAGGQGPANLGTVRPPAGGIIDGPPGMGGWSDHQAVYKDGKVYDAMTGKDGMVLSDYANLFEAWEILIKSYY